MATIELKEELHRKIDCLDDVSELLDLKYSIDWFIEGNLSKEERAVLSRLVQVLEYAENNKGISHDEVMKDSKLWLKK